VTSLQKRPKALASDETRSENEGGRQAAFLVLVRYGRRVAASAAPKKDAAAGGLYVKE
jgi:hypothetical protein